MHLPRRLLVVACAVILSGAAATARAASPQPHVTLIGDSVAGSLTYGRAKTIVSAGVDLDLETATCRRIALPSCPYQGVRPPTLLDVVQSLGTQLGPTVIVAVGYNDPEDQYAHDIDLTVAALEQAGVKRILWATLRAAQHPYLSMNDDIVAAAAQHPDLTIVDWNLYSRSHPDWFQPDGIHLDDAGAQAMATLFHRALIQVGVVVRLAVATRTLPAARHGAAYAARLRAIGGRAPYTWHLVGRAPRGLHVRPGGWIVGRPSARRGTLRIGVQVVDATRTAVTRILRIRVRP